MKTHSLSLVMAAVLLTLRTALVTLASDANWPRFRGPGGRGVADNPDLPDRWSATDNVAWKTEIPALGWSSPIVWGDRVFLTTAVSPAMPTPEQVWQTRQPITDSQRSRLNTAVDRYRQEERTRRGIPDEAVLGGAAQPLSIVLPSAER